VFSKSEIELYDGGDLSNDRAFRLQITPARLVVLMDNSGDRAD
jgi:hypothetical protein